VFHVEHSSDLEEYFYRGTQQLSLEISQHQFHLIERYLRELMVWNQKVNLTGARTLKDLVVKHVLDSLLPLKLLSERKDAVLLDVGSGSGFPGIPLKICLPQLKIVLLEPNTKKISFLTHVIGQLRLEDIAAERKSLKEFYPANIGRKKFDIVTSRALNPAELLRSARRLLADDGVVLLYRASPLSDRNVPPSLKRIEEIYRDLPFDSGKRVLTILGVA
jgi:16S rRNA (guanine527-N7)-methyltransferase